MPGHSCDKPRRLVDALYPGASQPRIFELKGRIGISSFTIHGDPLSQKKLGSCQEMKPRGRIRDGQALARHRSAHHSQADSRIGLQPAVRISSEYIERARHDPYLLAGSRDHRQGGGPGRGLMGHTRVTDEPFDLRTNSINRSRME